MEQEVKNTSAHPNKDLIFFLEIVLKACNEILKSEGKIGEQLSYDNLKEYNSTQGHFADRLCALIFDSHKEVIEKKIYFPIGNSKKMIEIETELPKLEFFPMLEEHDRILQELSGMLSNSFLENKNKKELQGKIADLLEQRKKIEKLQTPFPSIEIIEEYLSTYYRLLTYLMINEEFVRISETSAQLLSLLIRLDTNNEKASLLSPMAMNAVRKMYLGIEEYCKQISQKKMIDDVLNIFYQSVVIKKAQNSFRWFSINEDGKIWHYAVTPSCEISDSAGYLMIRGRSIQEYNSFEGIGEQRVGEKILYDIEKELQKLRDKGFIDKETEFNIAVLGDLNKDALKKMKKYVEDVLPFRLSFVGCENAQVKLNLHAYSKNFEKNINDKEDREIEYIYTLDDVFSDSEKVSKLIEENQLVFMLDCIKMYQPITVVPSTDILNLKQRFAFAEALESATIEKIDLCAPNYLELLYENMSVFNVHGFFGRLRKRANDAFLEFCQKQLKNIANKSDRNHSVYVYVSDLSAFANVYCNDQYFMRTERYNQKGIGIIRYTSDNTEKKYLPGKKEVQENNDGNDHPMICFNVWQIIKHICLEKTDEIINKIKEEGDEVRIYDLHRLYIGIDYNEWPKQLNLYYGIKEAPENEKKFQKHKDSYMRFLQRFAEEVVVPIFNDNNKNMFQQYFWRTIYSLLYGDSKDVRDMLFIHLLEEYRDQMGKAVLVEEHKAEHEKKVIDYVNVHYRYSIKRFYEKIMREYDISADNSFDQQWTAHIIDKNKTLEESSRDMFQKVVDACEELGYDKSYLYRNCSRILGIK